MRGGRCISFQGMGGSLPRIGAPPLFFPYRVPVGSVVVPVGVPVSRLMCYNRNIMQSRPALAGFCYSSLLPLLVFCLSLEWKDKYTRFHQPW